MRRVPVELQTARAECGLASLAMVAGYYDRSLDLTSLRRRWASPVHGLSVKDIGDLADELGFMSRGLRCEPQHLLQVRTPAILHWDMDHFVVLVRATRRGCVIHDPARGRCRLGWQAVGERFTGVLMELWPRADFSADTTPTVRLKFRDLLPLVRHNVRDLLWILLLSVLLQACALALPWHVQWTVDEAVVAGDHHLLGVLALGFALLLLVRLVTHWLRGALVIYVGHVLSFQMACGLLGHLLRLPLQWFEQRQVGDVVSRFNALGPVRELLTQGAAAMLVDGLMVLLALVLMLAYYPLLAFAVLAVHSVLACCSLLAAPRLKELSMSGVVAQAAEQSHMLESVRGVHNVKVYGQESARTRQWQSLHSRTLDESMKLHRAYLALGILVMFGGGLELICIVYLLADKVLTGSFSLGMLFAFVSYRGHFAERSRSLVERLVELKTMQVHVLRLSDIWCESAERLSELSDSCGSGRDEGPQRLTAAGLGFRHSVRDAWLLREVNFAVEPGEFIAIVGPSGSGKTTLLKVLMGLIDPTEGQLSVGGTNLIAGPGRSVYRRRIGCVLQEGGFFSGSIADNVVLSKSLDGDRLRDVLEQVGVWRALSALPMGVYARVGEIGSGLSSGQLQRLLLARALYQQPDYLFLDEGTANLDVASARLIHEVIVKLTCTRVVVTHDPAFAARADRTFQLEDGVLQLRVAKSAATPSAG